MKKIIFLLSFLSIQSCNSQNNTSTIEKEIDISKIDIDEFNIDQGLVEDYEELIQKNNGVYPPVILSKRYRIIDGTHRLNALTNLKYKTVIAFIGA